MRSARSVIALVTDFGLSDPFAGILKGVIAGIAPDARVIDLCHDIPPQDIIAGALALEAAVGYFPEGTIFVGVVDPGVGSARAAIAVETARAFYVGPDNGLFSLALAHDPMRRAVHLTNETHFLQPVSSTFHGRDIFAPVAARLAAGTPFDALGESLSTLTLLSLSTPHPRGETLEVHVLARDRFGNLLTDLTREAYHAWQQAENREENARRLCIHIQNSGVEIVGLSHTYAEVEKGELMACFGSGGRLEVGVREGSAAERLSLRRGDTLLLFLASADVL